MAPPKILDGSKEIASCIEQIWFETTGQHIPITVQDISRWKSRFVDRLPTLEPTKPFSIRPRVRALKDSIEEWAKKHSPSYLAFRSPTYWK